MDFRTRPVWCRVCTVHSGSLPGRLLPVSLETATVRVAPSPLPDEQSHAFSLLEASQLRGRALPFIVGVATLGLALAGFYWGVYVLNSAQESPTYECR